MGQQQQGQPQQQQPLQQPLQQGQQQLIQEIGQQLQQGQLQQQPIQQNGQPQQELQPIQQNVAVQNGAVPNAANVMQGKSAQDNPIANPVNVYKDNNPPMQNAPAPNIPQENPPAGIKQKPMQNEATHNKPSHIDPIPNKPVKKIGAVHAENTGPQKVSGHPNVVEDAQLNKGRDLKSEQRKRREICINDPNCEEKFDRNPLSDSYLNDNDYTRLLKIGGKRTLLDEADQSSGNRNFSGTS